MGHLNPEQLAFLRSQRVPLSQVFDASGMRKGDYAAAMKLGGFSFAYGTTPCAKGGHTLRTRAGHCIQCNTANIAYQLRHQIPGYVYVAGSHASGMLKVGTTNDLRVREWQLRDWQYGGASDWEMLLSSYVENAGAVEFTAHDQLRQHGAHGTYYREGRLVSCMELFRCSYDQARNAVLLSLPPSAVHTEANPTRSQRLWPNA